MKLGNSNQPQNKMQVNVDPRTLPSLTYDECKNDRFEVSYVLKKVSPLLSGASKEQYIPIDLFVCKKCGHLNDSLNPFKQIESVSDGDPLTTEDSGKLIIE